MTFYRLVIFTLDMYKWFCGSSFGTKYSIIDQVKFVEDSLKKFEGMWPA